MPNILITNDDGIHAPGLRVLAEGMRDLGTITIVAPSTERSASAQALTLRAADLLRSDSPNESTLWKARPPTR